MDLRSFVRQVLQDIEGALAEHVYEKSARVLERSEPQRQNEILEVNAWEARERMGDISFDVALTIAEKSEREGKGGISVFSGKMASESSRETVSRVQFTIHSQRHGPLAAT